MNFGYKFLKGKIATEIKSKLDVVLGDSSSSFSIVNFWVSNSNMHTSAEPHSGRFHVSKTATEIVDKIHFGRSPKSA